MSNEMLGILAMNKHRLTKNSTKNEIQSKVHFKKATLEMLSKIIFSSKIGFCRS